MAADPNRTTLPRPLLVVGIPVAGLLLAGYLVFALAVGLVFRRRALIIPTGKPMIQDQKTAPIKSSSVTGNRFKNISRTCSPLPRDMPHSPLKKSLSQMTYWT